MPAAFLFALAVAAVAAVADWRRGEIDNWITLPPLAAAPLTYGALLGPRGALTSVVSALVCASVPYGVFRSGGMGGGDVKLFAALGATTGFDIAMGLRIQLVSLVVAATVAIALLSLAWLRSLPGNSAGRSLGAVEPSSIRLGGPVLLGTLFVFADYVSVGFSIL